MKKFALLALTLVAGWSQTGHAQSQDANRQIIVQLCGQNHDANKTGSGVVVGDWTKQGEQRCIQVRCDETQDAGNSSSVIRTKCLSESDYQKLILGVVNGSGTPSGSNNGSGGTPSGSNNGSGGTPSGSNSGSGIEDGDLICVTKNNGSVVIGKGHACYKECNPRTGFLKLGKRQADVTNPKCIRCMQGKGYTFSDEVLKGAGIAIVTGVGVTECKDAQGRIVSRTMTGDCPSHNSGAGTTTIIKGGAAASAGAGGTVITGGTAANANAGVVISAGAGLSIPSECVKNNGKIKNNKKCQGYLNGSYTVSGNGRFNCSSGASAAGCIGTDEYNQIMARYYNGADCVNCGASGRKQSTLSGIAEIVGAIAPPLAMFGSSYFQSKAYQKSNEAWAGAAAVGFEQCRLSQQDYLNYSQTALTNYQGYLNTNELPGLSPEQQQAMLAGQGGNCNGYQLGGFAGLGGGYGYGYGGYIGGMAGGGYIGGMAGMVGGGYTGGYVTGGYIGGVSIAGGTISGMVGGVGGYPGGYVGTVGGVGGYPGGYVGTVGGVGGYIGGYPGGYVGTVGGVGGYPGGYVGTVGGGIIGGISLAGGMAGGGYPGGYVGTVGGVGGYPGGYVGTVGGVGGYAQGGYIGGYAQGGYAQGGYVSGYAGGVGGVGGIYVAGGMAGGGYYNGGYNGGWGSGVNQGNYYNSILSGQAANADYYMQQQGLGYNMGYR
jgi:hypothetical protein